MAAILLLPPFTLPALGSEGEKCKATRVAQWPQPLELASRAVRLAPRHSPRISLRNGRNSLKRPVAQAGLLEFITGAKTRESDRVALKEKLLAAIEPLERGIAASEEQQKEIDSLATKLESLNPTKDPLLSPKLNGKWLLLFTTSASILGKNKLPFLRPYGEIYQSIDSTSMQALNQETKPFFNQVQATLTAVSKKKVAVKFDLFKIFSLIPIKAPGSARGELEITYLDDNLRISRGNRGNLFVLSMADNSFRIPAPQKTRSDPE
eukprot:TRINITY_DN17988_c0_g1_i1.p1 TRINITY_DN17988_c0_g1~~TRINITY_DN17988_c0_g1_i1.p1  ORF type:complete len:265 (-),score=56.75 TRINITY_DN17988_c0_g1_i1:156-950(-)